MAVRAKDALCPKTRLERVRAHERPDPRFPMDTVYVVFTAVESEGCSEKFLGLVTEREIARFPRRTFADLLPLSAPTLDPEQVLELTCEPDNSGWDDEPLPRAVVTKDGRFLGVVSNDSAFAALFRWQRALLEETRQTNRLLEEDHAQLRAWSTHLMDLHEASRTLLGLLAHTTLHQDLLQGGIEAFAKVLQARYGAIGILDEDGVRYKLFVYTGLSAEQAAHIGRFPEGKGLLGVVVRQNQALRIDDMGKDPRSVGFPPNHPPMTSLLAVPVSYRSRVHGRIYLSEKLDGSAFTAGDELLASSFAHSLSLVLDNALEMEEIQRAKQRLDYMAHFDHLTGLPNRELLFDRIEQAIACSTRNCGQIAILFLDIDNFKNVNDTLGHIYGDQLLKSAADRLRDCVRSCDTVARLGGDEFVILLNNLDDPRHAMLVAEKLMAALNKPFVLDNEYESFVSASIGIVIHPADGDTCHTLLKHADMAMYHAKSLGRNNCQFFESALNDRIHQRLEKEKHLRRALDKGELMQHYQPKVDLETGAVIGVEALLRWHSPTLGPITPAEFIPIAEETGLILSIGQWTIRTACFQAKAWHDLGYSHLTVAVNLSPVQFRDPCLVESVRQALLDSGLRPSALELEITESVLMQSTERSVALLMALKSLGVTFSLDDFGTGYSSLNYLKRFPIDCLKIDQSFVRDLDGNEDDLAIVTAIIVMAESLNLYTVAEGVETSEQLELLRSRRCTLAQGFLLGRPVSADEITRLLETGRVERIG